MSDELKKIDIHVGRRIQARRSMLGLSQVDLAGACGISFQQIQKYEVADNRISVSRLVQIGTVLRVPATYFFDGLPEQIPYDSAVRKTLCVRSPNPDDPFDRTDVMHLVDLFLKLPSAEARTSVIGFIKMILSGGKKSE
jgi:transcriptional regulator with XRE-family HTH domain